MKAFFLSLLLAVNWSALVAQYDFPVVINGLSISLDLDSSRTVFPADWLVKQISDCYPDSILISRTVFPRGATPPAQAADSLVFNCDDFSSESIEIWWKDPSGTWLVTDSYALINGLDSCGCAADCAPNAVPILLNGFSTAFASGDSIVIAARELVAVSLPGQTYSFGPDPADSVRTFYCADAAVVNLEIFAHAPGKLSLSARTYLAINNAQCGSTAGAAVARVIQGLSVPSGPAGVVSIPARAFAAPFSGPQQLSFSPDPADTLFSVDCAQIGTGGINLTLYNHLSGNPGPGSPSYLIGDDGRRFCTGGVPVTPANDSLPFATSLANCLIFDQFQRAGLEDNEPSIDLADSVAGTVWYQFESPDVDNPQVALRIKPVDSLYFAVYGNLDGNFLDAVPFMSGLAVSDTSLNFCVSFSDGPWYLQIQGRSPGAITRYYLRVDEHPECPSPTTFLASEVARMDVFPNPASDFVKVRLAEQNQANGENLTPFHNLSVYSTGGRLLAQSSGTEVDIGRLPPGLYWLVAQLKDGRRFTEKLIKQ